MTVILLVLIGICLSLNKWDKAVSMGTNSYNAEWVERLHLGNDSSIYVFGRQSGIVSGYAESYLVAGFLSRGSEPIDVVYTDDGRICVVVGNRYDGSASWWRNLLVLVDQNGEYIKDAALGREFESDHYSMPTSITYLSQDDTFIVVGREEFSPPVRRAFSYGEDWVIWKIRADLSEMLWDNYIGHRLGSQIDEAKRVLVDPSDGNVLIGGGYQTDGGKGTIWIMTITKIDSVEGDVLWTFDIKVEGEELEYARLVDICALDNNGTTYGFVGEGYDSGDSKIVVGTFNYTDEPPSLTVNWAKLLHAGGGSAELIPTKCSSGDSESLFVTGRYRPPPSKKKKKKRRGFPCCDGDHGIVAKLNREDGNLDFLNYYTDVTQHRDLIYDAENDDILIGGKAKDYVIPALKSAMVLVRASVEDGIGCTETAHDEASNYPAVDILDYVNITRYDWEFVEEFGSDLCCSDCECTDCEDVSSWPFNDDEDDDDWQAHGMVDGCFECNGYYNQEAGSCNLASGGGTCVADQTCECYEGWDMYSQWCDVTICDGVLSNTTEPSTICNGLGDCTDYEQCTCHDPGEYEGEYCQYTWCAGKRSDHARVCGNSHTSGGVCWPYEVCTCYDGFFGDDCSVTTCNGLWTNDTNATDVICSGKGVCISLDYCECEYNLDNYKDCVGCYLGWYSFHITEQCNITSCHGYWSNETDLVCNYGNGSCVSPDYCECDETSTWDGPNCTDCKEGWYGHMTCDIPTCYGVIGNYTDGVTDGTGNQTCSGHGDCVWIDDCECYDYEEWSGDNCEIQHCFTISYEEDNVCNSNGECVDMDVCLCDVIDANQAYYGSNCEEKVRSGTFTNNLQNVLELNYFVLRDHFSGKKEKIMRNGTFNCSLIVENWQEFLNYNSSNCVFTWAMVNVGVDIHYAELLTINIISEEEMDQIEYEGGVLDYIIEDQANFTIKMISVTEPEVTFNIHLIPYAEEEHYYHEPEPVETGEATSYLWAAWVFPLVFVVLICACICLFCLFCCICILVICLFACFLVCGGSGASTFIYQQKKALSVFEELENFDLLLNEQKLEKDSLSPKIKIDKRLFEIDPEKVKLKKVLGEGGSEATVFLADWAGKEIAFKSFKTRSVCGNQNVYDEFERESSMMSSISHPYIIRFFGCCLKPPRIGFVMEYCENGDLTDYLLHVKEKEIEFTLAEKTRMMAEVASAMNYLHSRKVIHRDLKCENVLLDGDLHTKLMDFGISRVFDVTKQAKTKGIGTSIYISPEIVLGTVYNEKCDVYSFSILCHILYYENPYPYGVDLEFVEAKVASNAFFRPSFDSSKELNRNKEPIPRWLQMLIMNMWSHDPEKRKSFEETHQFLREKYEEIKNLDTQRSEAFEDWEQTSSHPVPMSSVKTSQLSPIFIYLKFVAQNRSNSNQFFLMNRTFKGLMDIINENYPDMELKRLVVNQDELAVKSEEELVIRNDEDMLNHVTESCLIDMEPVDDRDRQLRLIHQKVERMEKIAMEMKKRFMEGEKMSKELLPEDCQAEIMDIFSIGKEGTDIVFGERKMKVEGGDSEEEMLQESSSEEEEESSGDDGFSDF